MNDKLLSYKVMQSLLLDAKNEGKSVLVHVKY